MKVKKTTSFHIFCVARMIPTNIEIDFVSFVRDYLKSNYNMQDDTIFHYFEHAYSEEEVLKYWLMYIKNLKMIYETT